MKSSIYQKPYFFQQTIIKWFFNANHNMHKVLLSKKWTINLKLSFYYPKFTNMLCFYLINIKKWFTISYNFYLDDIVFNFIIKKE